ncbi:hypothetical protein GCM10010266_58490 [Streptomyces griseomycini]|uniref:hypothetical protein n=1 Tax=Streptomyces griseomycini TaxID=66895 RepID=UPI001875E403|nr:hypothetical protein [Streptomyces griseomycini]GGQ27454.1 hypothetical protein GCM10010266_58490 [Streptomyces griseomycini]
MSDQHAAATLTAAAVIAAILVARAVVLRQGDRRRVAREAHPVRGHTAPCTDEAASSAAALPDAASRAVREAEQHVHHCWQQFRTRVDPPE